MSALLQVKNLLVAHLKEDTDPKLKRAMLNVLNEIDSDLDEYGYETTESTDEAIEHLDNVLIGVGEEEDEIEDEIVLERSRVKVGDIGDEDEET